MQTRNTLLAAFRVVPTSVLALAFALPSASASASTSIVLGPPFERGVLAGELASATCRDGLREPVEPLITACGRVRRTALLRHVMVTRRATGGAGPRLADAEHGCTSPNIVDDS